jgi:nuclear mRNA export protein SAC3
MCPEFERLERITQNDQWASEMVCATPGRYCAGYLPSQVIGEDGKPTRTIDEYRMVKKFRRSAAGVDEQLPSDLRPPLVLKVGLI